MQQTISPLSVVRQSGVVVDILFKLILCPKTAEANENNPQERWRS